MTMSAWITTSRWRFCFLSHHDRDIVGRPVEVPTPIGGRPRSSCRRFMWESITQAPLGPLLKSISGNSGSRHLGGGRPHALRYFIGSSGSSGPPGSIAQFALGAQFP